MEEFDFIKAEKVVFYNEKPIVFSKDLFEADFSMVIYSEGLTDFSEVLLHLEQKDSIGVNLYFENVEQVFEKFALNFLIIEAAGGLVLNPKEEILFIHRIGFWDLPKGKLEKGESIKQAAVREVEEECSISGLELHEDLPTTYHIFERKGEKILKIVYWFKMTTEDTSIPVPQLEEGIDKVEWISKESLPNIMGRSYQNIQFLIRYFLSA